MDKKPTSGHLRLSTRYADAILMQLCHKNRSASSDTLLREWNESTSIIASTSTVSRRLCEAGYKAQIPRKKAVLTKTMSGGGGVKRL